MKYIYIILLSLLYVQSNVIFTNTLGSTTQTITQKETDLYAYTYIDRQYNTYKLYYFTTEEVMTCYTKQVTENNQQYTYVNLILTTFSVQFNYIDEALSQIQKCKEFCQNGYFNQQNNDYRLFHKNMLNFQRYLQNFRKNMLEPSNNSYQFDFSKLQEDHNLIVNGIFLDKTIELNQDLHISQYYILSSHNSYLEDNEYFGTSVSERALVRVLYLGFRFLELDLWPVQQSNNSEWSMYISVKHNYGYLQTNKIDFLSALKTIKDHAFVLHDSPLFITFENHLVSAEDYQYLIQCLKQSDLNFLFADNLNNKELKYKNLKNTVILIMDFSEKDINLDVQDVQKKAFNNNIKDLLETQYIKNPLLQFTTGFSFLTYMTDQIYELREDQTQSNTNTYLDQEFIDQQDNENNQNNIYVRNTNSQQSLQQIAENQNNNILQTSQQDGQKNIDQDIYYNRNKALKYVSMTKQCYLAIQNLHLNSFEEVPNFELTKLQVLSIKQDNACKQMTRIYTAFYRYLSGNFNPLPRLLLGVNMLALNSQNIDKNLIDYINFFTTRNGYREQDTLSIQQQNNIQSQNEQYNTYRVEIDEIYIPSKSTINYFKLQIYRRDMNYEKSEEITKKIVAIKDGMNKRKIDDMLFQANEKDYIYMTIGEKYRYSILVQDIVISQKEETENNTFRVALLRVLKNYMWDGAFIKVRITKPL